MKNCEKCAEMFPKKRKNVQILLKSQLSAQECWKCKIVLQIRKSAEKVPSAIGTGLVAKATAMYWLGISSLSLFQHSYRMK